VQLAELGNIDKCANLCVFGVDKSVAAQRSVHSFMQAKLSKSKVVFVVSQIWTVGFCKTANRQFVILLRGHHHTVLSVTSHNCFTLFKFP